MFFKNTQLLTFVFNQFTTMTPYVALIILLQAGFSSSFFILPAVFYQVCVSIFLGFIILFITGLVFLVFFFLHKA